MRAAPLLDVAAEARSVLARPAEIVLTIGETRVQLDHRDGIADLAGAPSLAVPADSPVAAQAERGLSARLRVHSGLDRPLDPARRQILTLSGRLDCLGLEECGCCNRIRHVIALRPDFVLLTTWAGVETPDFFPGRPMRVPLAAYCSPAYELNRGYLQTVAEHTVSHHHDELVQRVAALTGEPPAAVDVADLSPEGVWLQWVDATGGHRRRLPFDRPARTRPELATALSRLLWLGVC